MVSLFMTLFITLGVAYVLAEAFKAIGLPRVVGQIAAGIILGFAVIKRYLFPSTTLDVFSSLAELGIILLFFYLGLEVSFRSFTRHIKKSLLISLLNTALPFVIGFLAMRLVFGLDNLASLIVGVSLSVSAQAASADLLEELRMLRTSLGSTIIATGAVDDAIDLFLAVTVLSLFKVALGNSSLPMLFIEFMVFLIIVLAARVLLVPRALKFFDRERTSTARFTGAVLMLLLIASLAELLEVGALLGALAAGMIIRQTILRDKDIPRWEEHDIAKSLHIVAFGFLIPLFFVWVGLNIDTRIAFGNLGLAVLFVVLATAGTIGGSILAVLLSGGGFREGMLIGWGLNPKGDVELVIAALALKAMAITPSIFAAIVLSSVLCTIISPIAFKHCLARYGGG